MIVVDLDSVVGKKLASHAVCQMVGQALRPLKKKSGEVFYTATRPIYWLSKRKMTIDDLADAGFPRIGTVWQVSSVVEALALMVRKTDDHAEKIGMWREGKFRNPVYVVTDRDFHEIRQLGATPRPVQVFGAN